MVESGDAPLSDALLGGDLLHPAAVADQHRWFAALREADPVHWSEAQRGWVLTRYDDVAAALTDPRLSSDRARPLLDVLQGERLERARGMVELLQHWMVVNDPPTHTRLRRLAAGAFRPQRIKAMQDSITALVDELIDAFASSADGEFVSEFAFPLPATVIAELVGAPPEDRDRFRDWSQELALIAFGAGGEAREDRHERAMRGLEEMLGYFDDLIEQARRHPQPNMIGDLLASGEGEDRLTPEELRGMCALMLFAGHETTSTLITSALRLLLEHPDQLAALRADPSLTQGAVEESLRCDGPVRALIRWVTEDLEIAGRQIRAGQRVMPVIPAANRDPAKFPEPDVFDITRTPNVHVAFGKGVHACIGALLARIETRIALDRVLARLPGLALPEQELQWIPSIGSHSLRQLLVTHEAT